MTAYLSVIIKQFQTVKTAFIWISTLLLLNQASAQNTGCTDPLALNFDITASQNDGTCIYPSASVKPILSWTLPQALDETSGLILWNQDIWTHNDDTDINLYKFAVGDFQSPETFVLPGTTNTDWEEIAHDDRYVYVGDLGNNATGTRTDLHILRIEKASLVLMQPEIDTIWFSYEGQILNKNRKSNQTDFDCEAFVVSADSIYLFTKEWISQKTSVFALPKIPGSYLAKYSFSYDVNGLITGASYLENKKLVVLTGYSTLLQPFLLLLYDFSEQLFFSGNKRKVSVDLPFHQVEGIATADGLNIYLSNERLVQSFLTIDQKMHYLDVSGYLGDYLSGLTGLEYPEEKIAFQAYPNPFNHELKIEVQPAQSTSFELYTSIGSPVIKGYFNGKITLETSYIKPGFYLLKIHSGQKNVYLKLLKV